MYINKIHIQNYRNFNDFTMQFHKGLNVIVGPNNSGKTGLLYAVNLLGSPSDVSVEDFNKNNLLRYAELYTKTAPRIIIEYDIRHRIDENDTTDESIIRLLPFLGIKEFEENRKEKDGIAEYNISAQVKAVYSLDAKFVEEYRKAVQSEIKDLNGFIAVLKRFMNYYSWSYTNGISDTKADPKMATGVFEIRFIGAERTSEEVRKETKREIVSFAKEPENVAKLDEFRNNMSKGLEQLLSPSISKLSSLFKNENNVIGLDKGNVSISSAVRADFSLADAYITEVQDTKSGYTLPLQHNGLGYNNLINIYMLIKLTEIQKGRDFRILCLEEPEAHLHPAMQYKLFKYLRNLDQSNDLNQQIFVTTHSSNISAVAGIDNMFMLSYDREGKTEDCRQQSLNEQFVDNDGETCKKEAKTHLTKFLDVTRSDMLFADKVILVEGIAEKLLMPLFMEICGYPYEDEHISIVEIGGKHFQYFVELFNENAVKKKVLCITDNDFKWINKQHHLSRMSKYWGKPIPHVEKLQQRFRIDNFCVCTQRLGGRTFEDELFLENIKSHDVAKVIFKKALSDSMTEYFDKYGFDIYAWISHKNEIDKRSIDTIDKFLNAFILRKDKRESCVPFYSNLIFAEIFLHYVQNKKGDIALGILTDKSLYNEDGTSSLIVPKYIREGLEWLLK